MTEATEDTWAKRAAALTSCTMCQQNIEHPKHDTAPRIEQALMDEHDGGIDLAYNRLMTAARNMDRVLATVRDATVLLEGRKKVGVIRECAALVLELKGASDGTTGWAENGDAPGSPRPKRAKPAGLPRTGRLGAPTT